MTAWAAGRRTPRRAPLQAGDHRHGTANGYSNYACRCPRCTAAYAEYQTPQARARRAGGLAPNDPRHGTDNGYTNYGCRCERCIAARAAAHQKRRAA